MTTTLRSILRAHAANRPMVYLNDGGTTWSAETLLDELDAQGDDESRALLDAEDEYVTGEQGIERIGGDGFRNSIPDYRYTAAWESGEDVRTLDDLLVAAKQFGELDSDMPTFGGDEPVNTVGVWSYDATRMLVGTCADDLRIALRSDA